MTKPVPFLAEYRFDMVPEGTRVTMSAEPAGFTRLLWPVVLTRAGRKQYEANFAALKRVLESPA